MNITNIKLSETTDGALRPYNLSFDWLQPRSALLRQVLLRKSTLAFALEAIDCWPVSKRPATISPGLRDRVAAALSMEAAGLVTRSRIAAILAEQSAVLLEVLKAFCNVGGTQKAKYAGNQIVAMEIAADRAGIRCCGSMREFEEV